jgi:DNA uptake protein ComE-like DNA-binding protein
VTTTEPTLSSGWWRLRNSAWILIPILSVGMLTWAAFLFVGIRAKNRKWLIFAAMWLAILVGYYVGSDVVDALPASPVQKGVAGFFHTVPMLQWLVGIAHVAGTNRGWLRWKARHLDAKPWHSQGTGVAPAPFVAPMQAASAAQVDAALRGSTGVQAAPTIQAAPVAQLDINAATAPQLQAALGMDQAWGEWLVATRTRIGRYASVDQLLTEGKVPPHFYLPAKDKLMVSPPVRVPGARVRRRLDL